jgi:hypothetical protein
VIFAHVTADLEAILTAKRNDVAWKLRAVRGQFDTEVAPRLGKRRATTDALPAASVVADDGPSSRGASAPTSPPTLRVRDTASPRRSVWSSSIDLDPRA